MVSNYSILHFIVLQFINGSMDFFVSMSLPTVNIIPETLEKYIDYAIPELSGGYEKPKQIWKDLLKLGLMVDANLHM